MDDPTSPHEGLSLDIPAGAFPASTLVEVWAVEHPLLPHSNYAYEIRTSGATPGLPCQVRVPYDPMALYALAVSAPEEIVLIHESDDGNVSEAVTPDAVDHATGLVTATLPHFSKVYAYPRSIYHTVCIQRGALDTVFGVKLVTKGGVPDQRYVNPRDTEASGYKNETLGKGTIEDFWLSPRSLLLIHGFSSDAATFSRPATDPPAGLRDALGSEFSQIAIFQYQTGDGVEQSGDLLAEIFARAGPNFKCTIVAHSMGGLVARYAIENHVNVADRVDGLVTLGTPHDGSSLGWLTTAIPCNESAQDLKDGYADPLALPACPYYLIGTDADERVWPHSSALGLDEVPTAQKRMFPASAGITHGQLHEESIKYKVREQILDWIGQTQIPLVDDPSITIDGVVGTSEWSGALSLQEAFKHGASDATTTCGIRFLHDGAHLYVAITTPLPNGSSSRATLFIDGDFSNGRNGSSDAPYGDMSIQVGAPSASAYTYYRALTSATGYTSVSAGAGEAKASSGTTAVSYEFKIPLDDLGLLGGSGGGGGPPAPPLRQATIPVPPSVTFGRLMRLMIVVSPDLGESWFWPSADADSSGLPAGRYPAVWRRCLLENLGGTGGGGPGPGGGGP